MYIYRQCLDSTLCIITGSNWTVPSEQIMAVSEQYFMYNYRQYLDSTLYSVTGSIWTLPYVHLLAVSRQ